MPAYTELLIHSDTTDGSTTLTDSSGNTHTVTPSGDTHHEEDQSKFGNTSIFLDGTADSFSVDDSLIGATQNTFTIDMWVYPTASNTESAQAVIMMDGTWNSTACYWSFGLDTADKVIFVWYNGGALRATSTNAISLNTWTHIAVSVDAGTIRLFIDGVEETIVGTSALTNRTGTNGEVIFGVQNSVYYTGYYDEVRVSDGIARWTSGFTPETSPYTISFGLLNAVVPTPTGEASGFTYGVFGDFPSLTATATGIGSQGLLDADFSSITLEGIGAGGGILDVNTPSITLVATEKNVGALAGAFPSFSGVAAQLFDHLDGEFPAVSIVAAGGRAIHGDFPGFTVSAEGLHTNQGTLNRSFPKITADIRAGRQVDGGIPTFSLTATGLSGYIGGVDGGFPGFTAEITAGMRLDEGTPGVTLDATGISGVVGGVDGPHPRMTAVASGLQDNHGSLSSLFPKLSPELAGLVALLGTLDKGVPKIKPTATGVVGCVGGANGAIPSVTLSANIYQNISGGLTKDAPGFTLYSVGAGSTRMDDELLRYSRC